MEQLNDHDNLITIIEQVKNLTKSQADFHTEMRHAFEDLKNNYSGRLNNAELRLSKLETSRVKINTLVGIGIGLLSLISGLIIWHIMGK